MIRAMLILLSWLWGTGPATLPPPAPATAVQETSENPVNVMMKDLSQYYVAILSKGPAWKPGQLEANEKRLKESQEFKNLVESGKLVGIVRTSADANERFLLFFKTQSNDEAQAIVDSASLVKEKVLTADVYQIWGTRGMGKVLKEQLASGMKDVKREKFFLGLFMRGKNWKGDNADSSQVWARHHAETVLKWKSSGALKFYGIAGDTRPLPVRVMGIFSAKSLDAANKMMDASYSVKTGWYVAKGVECWVFEGMLP